MQNKSARAARVWGSVKNELEPTSWVAGRREAAHNLTGCNYAHMPLCFWQQCHSFLTKKTSLEHRLNWFTVINACRSQFRDRTKTPAADRIQRMLGRQGAGGNQQPNTQNHKYKNKRRVSNLFGAVSPVVANHFLHYCTDRKS